MNKDIKARDERIYGYYKESSYNLGGVRRFNNLSPADLHWLVENDFADPRDCQNDSPTLQEFLYFADTHPGFSFGGYAVSANRPDYRVSIDSIHYAVDPVMPTEYMVDFATLFRLADEFYLSIGYAWFD